MRNKSHVNCQFECKFVKIYWFITMQPLRQDNTVGTFAPFHTSIIYDMGGRGRNIVVHNWFQLILIFERSFLCTTVKLRKVMRTWGLFSEFYKIGPQTRLSALFQKKFFFQFCHYFDISEKKWPILPLMMSLSGKFECDFKKTLASFMIYHLSPRLYEWTLLGVIYFRIPSEIQWGETLFVEEQSY